MGLRVKRHNRDQLEFGVRGEGAWSLGFRAWGLRLQVSGVAFRWFSPKRDALQNGLRGGIAKGS